MGASKRFAAYNEFAMLDKRPWLSRREPFTVFFFLFFSLFVLKEGAKAGLRIRRLKFLRYARSRVLLFQSLHNCISDSLNVMMTLMIMFMIMTGYV